LVVMAVSEAASLVLAPAAAVAGLVAGVVHRVVGLLRGDGGGIAGLVAGAVHRVLGLLGNRCADFPGLLDGGLGNFLGLLDSGGGHGFLSACRRHPWWRRSTAAAALSPAWSAAFSVRLAIAPALVLHGRGFGLHQAAGLAVAALLRALVDCGGLGRFAGVGGRDQAAAGGGGASRARAGGGGGGLGVRQRRGVHRLGVVHAVVLVGAALAAALGLGQVVLGVSQAAARLFAALGRVVVLGQASDSVRVRDSLASAMHTSLSLPFMPPHFAVAVL
jgi:hypothetical protein